MKKPSNVIAIMNESFGSQCDFPELDNEVYMSNFNSLSEMLGKVICRYTRSEGNGKYRV